MMKIGMMKIGRLLQWKSQDFLAFLGRDDDMQRFSPSKLEEDNTPLKNHGNGEQDVNSVKQMSDFQLYFAGVCFNA